MTMLSYMAEGINVADRISAVNQLILRQRICPKLLGDPNISQESLKVEERWIGGA